MLIPLISAKKTPEGIVIFMTPSPGTASWKLQYSESYAEDEKFLDEDILSTPEFVSNYTYGHSGDLNHLWRLKNKEIHRLSGNGHYKAVCILYYEPANPEFLKKYSESLR